MSVEIIGEEELAKALKGLEKGISQEVMGALVDGGQVVRANAISSISEGSPQGTIYKRGNVTHKASSPGQAPASDTGRLVSKISVRKAKEAVFVGSNLKYAKYLELGTQHIEARPWLIPALEGSRRSINELVKKAIKQTIRRQTK